MLSIVIGARTEEIRSLTRDQIDTAGEVPTMLVGHDGTDATERVYRHRLRPVRRSAAKAMDDILNSVG